MKRSQLLVFDKNDDVQTNETLLAWIWQEFAVDFDPCPCPRPDGWDGLAPEAAWGRRNFVNPPYSNIRPWLEKALQQLKEHERASVFLIPVRSNSKYWRELVYPNATGIHFFPEKVAFRGFKKGLPIPLCLLQFEPGAPRCFRSTEKTRTTAVCPAE